MVGLTSDLMVQHAELIGRVTIAWNDLNHELAMLFELFSGLRPEKAAAIYFTPRSDSAQRDLVSAVGRVALVPYPALLENFKSCMAEIGRLSSERNAAIHTAWVIEVWEDSSASPQFRLAPSARGSIHKALKPDFGAQFEDLQRRLGEQFWKLHEIRLAAEALPL